jgi:hypothetical protein
VFSARYFLPLSAAPSPSLDLTLLSSASSQYRSVWSAWLKLFGFDQVKKRAPPQHRSFGNSNATSGSRSTDPSATAPTPSRQPFGLLPLLGGDGRVSGGFSGRLSAFLFGLQVVRDPVSGTEEEGQDTRDKSSTSYLDESSSAHESDCEAVTSTENPLQPTSSGVANGSGSGSGNGSGSSGGLRTSRLTATTMLPPPPPGSPMESPVSTRFLSLMHWRVGTAGESGGGEERDSSSIKRGSESTASSRQVSLHLRDDEGASIQLESHTSFTEENRLDRSSNTSRQSRITISTNNELTIV